ncbi:hypothetical protein DFH07DRAFT_171303 [Mycena maculata]|uniref:Uncharacterized protein n=1 Tax=Mycena maculata TaxID=230809 RepID=A0AAD7JY26_9AGAR|nr:hypothetical protein DFH07DRAFT_171303 [Mycena maculata]
MASLATPAQIKSTGQFLIIYGVVGLVIQTFFYGVYTVLIVLSTRMLLKRGLKSRANKVMFIVTMFMYLLSAAYWAYSVADVVDRMKLFVDDPQNLANSSKDAHDDVTKWSPVFNALSYINYILSDAVVVWRAWVLCLRKHRKYLCITIVFFILTSLAVVGTIVFNIIAFVAAPYAILPNSSYLVKGINVLQITMMGMSLLSNISATTVVGVTAWHHRQAIQDSLSDSHGKKHSRADQILSLVVESGLLYSISGLTVLVFSLIRIPYGTLGDLYTPINVQIAGAYPPVVLLLVSTQKSLNDTTFLNTLEVSRPTHSTASGANSRNQRNAAELSIQFAGNPDFAMTQLGTQTEAILGSDDNLVYGNTGEKF